MRYWMVKLFVWMTTAALSYCFAAVHLGKIIAVASHPAARSLFRLPDSVFIRTSHCCKCDFIG